MVTNDEEAAPDLAVDMDFDIPGSQEGSVQGELTNDQDDKIVVDQMVSLHE